MDINNSVDIYYVQFSKQLDYFEKLFELLDEEEKSRALRFYFDKDKKSFTIARAYLKILISKYLKINNKDIHFSYNKYGKSYLKDSNLYFNISHSKDFAVYAFSTLGEVGIDIEFMREKVDFKNIIHRYFSKSEIIDFNNVPEHQQKEAFFNGWSRKEAYIKAKGKGLSIPLNSFDVTIKPNDKVEIKEIRDEFLKENWFLYKLDISKEYKSALVTSFYVSEFKIEELIKYEI